MSKASELVKQQYGALFFSVSALIFDIDPMRINLEDNTDEYDPEVATILPRLHTAQTVLEARKIIHEEFVRWFGDMAGDKSEYTEMADKVWELWEQRNN